MRRVWKDLSQREDLDPDMRAGLTWKQANDICRGKTITTDDFDRDNWKDKKAQEIVDLFRRHNVAKGLLEDPEVTALALSKLHENLPGRLIEEWAYAHQELISELAKDIVSLPEDAF